MKKEYHHFAFGLFIEEVLKCEKWLFQPCVKL